MTDQALTPHGFDEPTDRGRLAYTRLLAEIDAVPDAKLVSVNLDVLKVVTKALGVSRAAAGFAEQAKTLPGFDASCFTKLEAYAWALHHAEVLRFVHAPPKERTGPIAARALTVRDLLLADARALSSHGLIEPNRVASRTRVRSHAELAFDVMRLLELLYESWPEVSDKTALTLDDLKEHELLAFELLMSIGRRNRPREVAEATVRRQRVFTLLVTAYNQVRRAVLFFRAHEGDADRFAPSLFGGRKNGNHRTPEPQPAPAAPSGVRVAIDTQDGDVVEPARGFHDRASEEPHADGRSHD